VIPTTWPEPGSAEDGEMQQRVRDWLRTLPEDTDFSLQTLVRVARPELTESEGATLAKELAAELFEHWPEPGMRELPISAFLAGAYRDNGRPGASILRAILGGHELGSASRPPTPTR